MAERTNCCNAFKVRHMIDPLRVFRATEMREKAFKPISGARSFLFTFHRHDELRDNRQDSFGASPFGQEIFDTVGGEEDIRVLQLSEAVKQKWQVVMVIQSLDRHLWENYVVTSDLQVLYLMRALRRLSSPSTKVYIPSPCGSIPGESLP